MRVEVARVIQCPLSLSANVTAVSRFNSLKCLDSHSIKNASGSKVKT